MGIGSRTALVTSGRDLLWFTSQGLIDISFNVLSFKYFFIIVSTFRIDWNKELIIVRNNIEKKIAIIINYIILFLFCSGPASEGCYFIWGIFLLQVFIKGIHLTSIMGNKGTFGKNFHQVASDNELIYHILYLICCFLCFFKVFHPFFFSVLVSFFCLCS